MKFSFPWLASGIGLVLVMVLIKGGALAEEDRALPLLTLLFISEFGFLVTAAGGYVAVKELLQADKNWRSVLLSLACLSLAIAFFTLGIQLWRGFTGT